MRELRDVNPNYKSNQTGVDRDKPRNLEFGLWTLDSTEDDSGLPTGPLTITKTLLKHFFDSLDSWTHSCPLSCFSDS